MADPQMKTEKALARARLEESGCAEEEGAHVFGASPAKKTQGGADLEETVLQDKRSEAQHDRQAQEKAMSDIQARMIGGVAGPTQRRSASEFGRTRKSNEEQHANIIALARADGLSPGRLLVDETTGDFAVRLVLV